MPGRYYPAPGLDERVAAAFLLPEVIGTEVDLRGFAKEGAPVDTGRLRYEVDAEPAVLDGTRVTGTVHSSAIDPDSGDDYAAFQEYGTRYIKPRRYMARGARRTVQKRGTGHYDPTIDPWPHR